MNEQQRRTPTAIEQLQEAAWQYQEGSINEEEFLGKAICELGTMADEAARHRPADENASFYGCAEQMPEVGVIANALVGMARLRETEPGDPPRPWDADATGRDAG